MKLELEVTVRMGGSTGVWVFADTTQIIQIGCALDDLLGQPHRMVEADDVTSAMAMAVELVRP